MHCEYCDPSYVIIYGFCSSCGRRCEPPLFDCMGSMSILEYNKFKEKWNIERADLFTDQLARMEKE